MASPVRMTAGRPPDPRRAALVVWLQLLGLLLGVGAFGWVVFRLTRSLA